MFNKLKQFQDIKKQAKTLQDQLAAESVSAKAAGDKVVLTMDGNMKITGLAIDDEMMDVAKKEKLQEAIKSAYTDASKQMQRIMAMKIKDMGGLPNIPGLS